MTTLILLLSAAMAQGSDSKFEDSAPVIVRGRGNRPPNQLRPAPPPGDSPFRREEPEDAAFHEYNAEISRLFKQESAAQDAVARAAVIHEMCGLHARIVSDTRYETSDTLKQYRGRLWSRLTKVKAELKRQLAREAGGRQTLDDLAALEQADPLAVAAADSLSLTLAFAGQSQGGPAAMLGFGGRAGPPDHGRELVELIERTINPAFWDVNGGPGTIVYYQPLQCLVVRATSEAHRNVGAALGGLREAR